METNVYLKSKLEERASLTTVVENLQRGAAEKGRDLTEAERQTIADSAKRLKFLDAEVAQLTEVMKGAQDFQEIYGNYQQVESQVVSAREREAARRAAAEQAAQRQQEIDERLSWGERFVRSEEFKSYGGGGASRRFNIEGAYLDRASWEERADITSSTFASMGLPEPMVWGGPTVPAMRTPLFDVIGIVPTSSGSVEYYYWHLSDPDHMAPLVPEGELKPEAPLDGELKAVPMETYAWHKGITRQALDDIPMLRGLIDTQLRRGIIRRINAEAGTALTTNTDIQSAGGGGDIVGQIRRGIALIDDNGFSANAVLLNPMDWADLDTGMMPVLQRNTAEPRGPQVQTVFWGMRPVAVPAVPQGTAYVGDFSEGMTFFDRQQTQVFLTDSHADFFLRNKLVLLAEARGKVVVTNAAAIIRCEGSAGGGDTGIEGGSAGIAPASGQASAPRQRRSE